MPPNVCRQFVSPVADDPDFLALRDWRVGFVAAEVAVHAGESLMRPFGGFHTPGCDAEYHSVTGESLMRPFDGFHTPG